jgi:hypothetical protein
MDCMQKQFFPLPKKAKKILSEYDWLMTLEIYMHQNLSFL